MLALQRKGGRGETRITDKIPGEKDREKKKESTSFFGNVKRPREN